MKAVPPRGPDNADDLLRAPSEDEVHVNTAIVKTFKQFVVLLDKPEPTDADRKKAVSASKALSSAVSAVRVIFRNS